MLNELREAVRTKRKMVRVYETVTVLICTVWWIFCAAECPPEIGQPLDLNQFSGEWFFIGGTPVHGRSLSRCGQFVVKKISPSTFAMRYTALSHRNNSTVTFNVGGIVGKRIITNWQLQGSKAVLGPFRHVIVSVNYNTALAMIVCSENSLFALLGYKFSMIWSRERSLPPPIFEELKSKLGTYINQEDILMADHRNC